MHEGLEDRFSDDVNWLIWVVFFLAPSKPTHSDGEHAAGGRRGGPHKVLGTVSGFIVSCTSSASVCGSTSSIGCNPTLGYDGCELGGLSDNGPRM